MLEKVKKLYTHFWLMTNFFGLCAAKYSEIITIKEQFYHHARFWNGPHNEHNVDPNTKPTPGIITSNIHLVTSMSELNIYIYILNICVPS